MGKDKDTTVIRKEINFFSDLHNTWWDSINGPMKPLHSFNKVRVPLICDSVGKSRSFKDTNYHMSLQGLRVLDAGCGGGILSEALANCGAKVVGLDASEDLIEIAKLHSNKDSSIKDRIQYVAATIEDYSIKHRGSFDVVVTSEVIEHVADPDLFLKHCCDLVKPGGSIIVTTINKTLSSLLIAIIYFEYVTGAFAKGTHEWHKFVSPATVSKTLQKYGWEIKKIQGTKYNR